MLASQFKAGGVALIALAWILNGTIVSGALATFMIDAIVGMLSY